MQKMVAILLLMGCTLVANAANTLTIRLFDKATKQPVPDVAVYAQDAGGTTIGTISDDNGTAHLRLDAGTHTIFITHIQYKPLQSTIALRSDTTLAVPLQSNTRQLQEVVVTASESKKISSVSTIGRDAMSHLQPTSLNDLVELLPGGIAQTPALTQANTIALRETGTLGAQGQKVQSNNYATNSLGTLFVVDGAPINTDANLQYAAGGSNEIDQKRDITNRGVDMRTISTDDIESVEVIRGIPSVEYGNLTSGVMNIKRIRKPTKLNARFKADDKSQLFAIGKGFALDSAKKSVMNIDGGLLNAYADIRNPLENYKRANVSVRLTSDVAAPRTTWRFTPSADYTGSFDNYKTDENLSYGGINTFKSTYHKIAVGSGVRVTPNDGKYFKMAQLHLQATQQFDWLDRQVLVAPTRVGIAPSSTEPGEYDAHLLFGQYVARYQVDGKPFTAFAKASADFDFNAPHIRNALKFGLEWNLSKNFGKGQIYDLSQPLSVSGWGTRPRAYNDIPALQTIAFYAQDYITAHAGNHTFDARLGVRGTAMPGLDKRYAIHGRCYIDPRINLQWTPPSLGEKQWKMSFSGGIGWTTRMPTLNYLYPDPTFVDIIQLGFYSQTNPEKYSRYNIVSYKQDATNYDLQPARNRKWEVRADFEVAGNRLWVCFFDERMSSGFRYSNQYSVFSYKSYDASSINSATLTDKPDLNTLPYETKQKLDGYRFVENGSKQNKIGVEWEFSSCRIKPLRTAIRFSGAWFRSTYVNSRPMYYSMSSVVDGVIIADNYVGLYDWNEGRVNEQLSTNLLLDTQIPEWGLIFSTSVQAMWFVATQRLPQNGTPKQYLSADDGQLHDYTAKVVAENPLLQHLIYSVSDAAFERYTIPPAIYVNLKITKNIGQWLSLSLFVNKLIDYTPDFKRNGVLIRRNESPYFGMEMTFKI